jgi:SHS2 domain-containing protein
MKKFEFFDHTSEIKFKSWGQNLNEAFENAILAVADFIGNGQKIKHARGEVVNIKGKDKEELLYNFLEEVLVLLDSRGFLTAAANVSVLGNTIKAELFGDDAENYEGLDHIKSPTYAEMHVLDLGSGKGWEIQCVMDV